MKASYGMGLFFFMLACSTVSKSVKADPPHVEGHRGSRALFPENTLPAFEEALRAGADVLEMDLGVTRDGVLVLSHNQYLDPALCLGPKGQRIAGKKGPLIHSLTLAELKKYDCGSLKHPDFPLQTPVPGTPIPTLEELIQYVKNSPLPSAARVRFNIETKITEDEPDNTVGPEEFVRRLVQVLRANDWTDRSYLQSFDYRTVVEAHKQAPTLKTIYLVETPFMDYVEASAALGLYAISPHYRLIRKNQVEALHARGVKVIPWTANDEKTWKKLIDMNVDGIISDNPRALIEYLTKEGLRP